MEEEVGKRIQLKSSRIIADFLHGSTGTILEVQKMDRTWHRDAPLNYVIQLDIPKENGISLLSKMNMEKIYFDFYDGEDVI